MSELNVPSAAPDASLPRHAAGADGDQFAAVSEVIQSVRPGIQADGGDIELVAIQEGIVRVRLTGACTHCALAGQTLGGIRRKILATLGVHFRVLPALTD